MRNAFNILRNVALSIKVHFSDHWTAELSLRARRLIVAAVQIRGLSTGYAALEHM